MSIPAGRRIKKVCGETYWTSSKAAEHMGVCKNTILNVFCKNGLSYLKIGGYKLFKKEWLDDYINEKTKIQTYREKK